MPDQQDASEQLLAQIKDSIAERRALDIRGGQSKQFLGATRDGEPLDMTTHRGVISYEPTELVVTARCGTPLLELEQQLAERDQYLPFEPPRHTPNATLGGAMASALSGPSRPFSGGVRDFVLGCRVINGQGQLLNFGGQVMKNVAGYDVTRLMTGARGTLGPILDISMKVLPRPAQQITVTRALDLATALTTMQQLKASNHPVTGACYHDGHMKIRLAGSEAVLRASSAQIGAASSTDNHFWTALRDQTLAIFDHQKLWRITVPHGTPELDLDGECLHDWAGEQRWLASTAGAEEIRHAAASAGGFAQLYKASPSEQQAIGVEHPLPEKIMQLQRNIKQSFDPLGVFNPGRLYPSL